MNKFKKIYIEITNICNLNCSFCNRTKKKPRTMTKQEFEFILKQISGKTDYIYLHVQGEPLLHFNLKEILELCDKYQKKVNIITNGTLISSVKDILINTKALRQIVFSLHSFDGDNLNEYLSPILEISDILIEKGVIVSYRFWNDDLKNNNAHTLAMIKKHYQLKENITCQKIKNNLYLNHDKSFVWPTLDRCFYQEEGTCYGTRTHIAILSDGTVVPCCLDKDGIIDLGNIFTTSLDEILASEKYQKIKQGFLNKKKVEELCKHCDFIS